MRAEALTSPAGANANQTFHDVLKLDPNNLEAKDGLYEITSRFFYRANSEKDKKRYREALTLVEQGLSAISNEERLLTLKAELQLAIKQQQQEQRDKAEKLRLDKIAKLNKQKKDKEEADKRQKVIDDKIKADKAEAERLAAIKRADELAAAKRKLEEELERKNQELANKDKLKPGKHKKILVVGHLAVPSYAQNKTSEGASNKTAYNLSDVVETYMVKGTRVFLESDLDLGVQIVNDDAKGKISRDLCRQRSLDYVVTGTVEPPGSGFNGIRTGYVSLYNCSTGYFKRADLDTTMDGRIPQLKEKLREVVKDYIKAQ